MASGKVKGSFETYDFKEVELDSLINEFMKRDTNSDGSLDEQEFAALLGSIKNAEQLKGFFKVFDTNNDGKIDFREFVSGISILRAGSADEKLKLLFEVYDADKNGKLTQDELARLLQHLTKAAVTILDFIEEGDSEVANRLAANVISKLDINKDGEVSLEEWLTAGPKTPALMTLLFPTEGKTEIELQ